MSNKIIDQAVRDLGAERDYLIRTIGTEKEANLLRWLNDPIIPAPSMPASSLLSSFHPLRLYFHFLAKEKIESERSKKHSEYTVGDLI